LFTGGLFDHRHKKCEYLLFYGMDEPAYGVDGVCFCFSCTVPDGMMIMEWMDRRCYGWFDGVLHIPAAVFGFLVLQLACLVFGLGKLGASDEGKGSVAHSGFDCGRFGV
jgi:hypothetical protein